MTQTRDGEAGRVRALAAFVGDAAVVPILVQRDPDPDGMASALGLRTLLERSEADMPIVSLGEVTRAENRRLAELLGIRVTRVTEGELKGFGRVIAVDTQPSPEQAGKTRYAVIDHHPPRDGLTAELLDIRPELGAAATMTTRYLRAVGTPITARLATALLYGIRTDTDLLRRGTTAADIEAYAFLQELADAELLSRIARPAFAEDVVVAMGAALGGLRRRDDVAVVYLGRLDERSAHALPTLADFCLAIEGVSWAAAAGWVEDELVINVRRTGGGAGANDLAKALVVEAGEGGGHHSMARAAMPAESWPPMADEPGDGASAERVLARVADAVERVAALRSGRPSAASGERTGRPPRPEPESATAVPRPNGRTGW